MTTFISQQNIDKQKLSIFLRDLAGDVKVNLKHMIEDMDVNAGKIVSDNSSIEEVGKEIFDLVIRVASGEKSKSEMQGLGDLEFVPWQIGATM